jgi:predicted exporter
MVLVSVHSWDDTYHFGSHCFHLLLSCCVWVSMVPCNQFGMRKEQKESRNAHSLAVASSVCSFLLACFVQQFGVFIVLGIGADDCFVFVDAWKQSYIQSGLPINCPIAERMHWTWKRSAKAMGITSLTSFAAFMTLAFFPIPSMRVLGIFTAVSIVITYIMVITWYAAAVVCIQANQFTFSSSINLKMRRKNTRPPTRY